MSKWSKSRGRRYRKLLPLLHEPKVYILSDLGLITGREGLNELYVAMMAKLLNESNLIDYLQNLQGYGENTANTYYLPKILYPTTKL